MRENRKLLKLIAATAFFAISLGAIAGPQEDFDEGKKAYFNGDVVSAMRSLRKAADQGHGEAQTMLAFLLDQSEEDEEAVKYYRKAADQGISQAELGLGLMYAAGEGVKKDEKQALEWIRRAADKGELQAINVMADSYWGERLGLKKEPGTYGEALRWMRLAADKGYAGAVNALSDAYVRGDLGLPQQPDYQQQGQSWLTKAAEASYPPAYNTLVQAYAEGNPKLGIEKNHEKLVAWLNKQAQAQQLMAMQTLAEAYRKGSYGLRQSNRETRLLEEKINDIKKKLRTSAATKEKAPK